MYLIRVLEHGTRYVSFRVSTSPFFRSIKKKMFISYFVIRLSECYMIFFSINGVKMGKYCRMLFIMPGVRGKKMRKTCVVAVN